LQKLASWRKMLNSIDLIKQRISDRHTGDQKQLDVIFSPSHRLLIEAPAGYGKTKTMVSRIAYMLATQQIPYPKRLLALTFSVNAAHKIKKDIKQQIPELLQGTDFKVDLNEKVFVANYHKFCWDVLRKQGYILHKFLLSIEDFETTDDAGVQKLPGLHIDYKDAVFLDDYSKAVNEKNKQFIIDNINKYCDIVIHKLLPEKVITYNSLITLTIKLFRDYPSIKDFYNNYFVAIITDEYQDTNLLDYWLINLLITEKTKTIFLGDPLQRIYDFIGAVPDLFEMSEKRFGLKKIALETNHRFKSNPQMLQLDENIRKNALNPSSPSISKPTQIDFTLHINQDIEAQAVLQRATSLLNESPDSKIAILVKHKKGNHNLDKILNLFDAQNVPYFYGLFTDQESLYTKFHKNCLIEFKKIIEGKGHLTKKMGAEHLAEIKRIYSKPDPLSDAVIKLLDIFWIKFFSENAFLDNNEKKSFVKETFEHNGLKQYIEFVQTNIIFSTVHAAKGLEWDYVILPDMEQGLFPNKWGLCKNCSYKKDCIINITPQNEKRFLEELNVFYVAVTRAKKQVYFYASTTQIIDNEENNTLANLSCLLKLPGITI